MTSRLTNLPVPFVFRFYVTTAGTPEQLSIKRRAVTIGFVENTPDPDTITDSANGFLVAGFQPGDTITVSGSVSNDGDYVIKTVTAGVITLRDSDDLVTEGAAATVKITANKNIPDGIGVTIKGRNANSQLVYLGYSLATALNTADAAFTIDNNESVGLQIHELSDLWLDVGVSGEGVEIIFEKGLQV